MRILAIHFWDTRPSLRDFWPKVVPIWEHNFDVMWRNFPPSWELEHFIFVNQVAERPCVPELVERVQQRSPHTVNWVRWHKKLGNRGKDHLVVFNKVAHQAYETLGHEHAAEFDLIFHSTQDFVMANHFGANWFVVLSDLMRRDAHSRNEKVGWYSQLAAVTTNGVRVEECDYVSHTVLPDAAPLRFRHNGSASVGMWKASELSYVLLSVGQLDRAAECHLGNRLRRHCLYLKPCREFYFGGWIVDQTDPAWPELVVERARDPNRTAEIRRRP